MPIRVTLEECLQICHHYESLQLHLNVTRPDTDNSQKVMDGLAKQRGRPKKWNNKNQSQSNSHTGHTDRAGTN